MKKRLICLLAAALLLSSLFGCQKKDDNPGKTDTEQNQSSTGDPDLDKLLEQAKENGPVKPEGMTEIWFDELFRAFYPKQLADVYPTQLYVYGDLETSQPVMCFCSEDIADLELFSYADGQTGELLYTVEALKPMEALVLQVEVTETPSYCIRFTDKEGKNHAYTLAEKADSSEIVLTELAP